MVERIEIYDIVKYSNTCYVTVHTNIGYFSYKIGGIYIFLSATAEQWYWASDKDRRKKDRWLR